MTLVITLALSAGASLGATPVALTLPSDVEGIPQTPAVVMPAEGHFPTGPAAATAERGGAPRALYVWHGASADTFRFATRKGIRLVYLNASPGFSAGRSVTDAARLARSAGLSVYALAGAPSWAREPAKVSRWVDEVVRSALFDGMLVDIEPYVDDAWDDDLPGGGRSTLIGSYLKGLRRGRRRARDLSLTAVVPFWFDGDKYTYRGRSLVSAVARATDGINVLAYRDHAEGRDGIIDHALDEVALGTRLDVPVWISVQTARDELDKLTYFEEGEAALERDLRILEATLSPWSGFAGIALHHYDAYRDLRR